MRRWGRTPSHGLQLQSIFATVDSQATGYVIPDGARPGIAVPTLKYADDAALISALEEEMTARMTAIEEGSLKLADMVIARQKTFYMPIAPPVAVNATTEDEVIALNLPFTCEHCDHSFDSRAGLCTHTMLWCGEAGRQTWEEDFIVASIDGVRGPPDKRFFRVHWEGVNETGKIVRGGHAGDDTMPGEPWKPTWEPFRHLQSETAHIDLFWQLNPDLSPADDINVSTEHRCTDCNFFSVSERGLATHKKSCRSKTRSRNGSRSDKAVQRK